MIQQMDIDNAAIHGDADLNYSSAFNSMPPGEEGFDFSHEGGEFEVFEAFADDLARLMGRCVYYTQQLMFYSNNHIQANVMTLEVVMIVYKYKSGTGRFSWKHLQRHTYSFASLKQVVYPPICPHQTQLPGPAVETPLLMRMLLHVSYLCPLILLIPPNPPNLLNLPNPL